MDSLKLKRTFFGLTTPHVADACMRLGIPIRHAPASIRPAWKGANFVGRVCPARHYGSVDVFLEAIDRCERGDVLVVDNGGLLDEACIGDLVTLEASQAGIAGIVIWGLHRDTAELKSIGLPVLSLGALPIGPQRLDKREPYALISARCGDPVVTAEDFALCDDDGVLFIPLNCATEVAEIAASIRDTERNQAARMQLGQSFREQARFDTFIKMREADPGLTFRQHLRSFGGEIEE